MNWSSKSHKKTWENSEYVEKHRNIMLSIWQNEENRKKYITGRKRYLDSLTEEQKLKFAEKTSISSKKVWDNLTDEQRQERIEKLTIALRNATFKNWIPIIVLKNGQIIGKFKSTNQCVKILHISPRKINYCLVNQCSYKGYIFQYLKKQ